MKYAIQTLILVVFLFVSMYIYQRQKIMQQNEEYQRKLDSAIYWIGTITHSIDSLQHREQVITTNIKRIHHVYDSTHHVIYWLSDSSQKQLLYSNIERYKYLLNDSAGEDN